MTTALMTEPDDVVKFSQADPAQKLQEIPLAEMSVTLTSFYTDDANQTQQRTVAATTVQDMGNGDFLITFDSILGSSVIGLYRDLTFFGKAVINLSASYQAWSQPGGLVLSAHFRRNTVLKPMISEPVQMSPLMFTAKAPSPAAAPVNRMRSFAPSLAQQQRTVPERPENDTLVQTRQSWVKPLPLGLKYQHDGYQLKYTVSTENVSSHVIRDTNDLKDFSLSQTEFLELKALGDISQRYSTLSRLYMGVLSRTIVVIPKRYSIVRGRLGCLARCLALMDSSAASGSKCKFQFDFTIAPEVSRIEILRLTQEVLGREELKDCTLKLPDFHSGTPLSTLQTTFVSNVQFSAGADPHTFVINAYIHDDDSQYPAVANANLFIKQLCSDIGVALQGSLSIKLDDGFPNPVSSPIELNFVYSVGTDEIAVELKEESAEIKLTNQSPIDLHLSRYALIRGLTLNEFPGAISLPATGSLSLPLPEDHASLMLAWDAQMVIPNPMTKSDVPRFLQFQTADVQETQYVVAANGSGIDFNKVDSVVISITFTNLPSVVPRTLKLFKDVHSDSTHIVIPLENAVFSLPGTVHLAVHFVAPGMNDLNFTLENDFTSSPVLFVLQSDIDKSLPKP